MTLKFEEFPYLSKQNCTELIINFVTYVPFRVVQIFQTSLSVMSIPILLFVIRKYIYGSSFHLNIKIIFILYYSFATGHAMVNASMQIYQIIRSMLPDPCKAFPTRVEYETFNLSLASMTIGVVAIQLAILFERAVATFWVHNYEKHDISSPSSL
ncbi:hypothetical protein RB195_004539 [Necator americanus]|uniref:Serpentine receptor class gamma n=1 Tax=Necator americanus TaxID=51031 RepID=A0ABR1BIH9_NECAM